MATYESALKWLNENRPFLMTYVIALGKPQVDNARAKTAQVQAVPGTRGKFELVYNSDFFDPLSDEHAAGILAHETLHIFYRHLKSLRKYPDDERQKVLMACECIVNDTLSNDFIDLPDGAVYGPETVGMDCSGATIDEVMALLPPDMGKGGGGDGHGDGCIDLDSLDQMTDEQVDDLVGQLKQIAQQQGQQAPQSVKDAGAQNSGDKQVSKGKVAGDKAGELEALAKQTGVNLKWIELLAQVNPDIMKHNGIYGEQKTSWHAPRRKMAWAYPKTLLPTTREKESDKKKQGSARPHVVLALDFSGSIPRDTAKRLAALANSVPDSISVDACTFSTQYVPFDPKSDSNKTASGGTDFSAVEEFVRSVSVDVGKPYPKAVIVMTDGEAGFGRLRPTQEQLDQGWSWFMVESGWGTNNSVYDRSVKSDTIHQLKDYIEA